MIESAKGLAQAAQTASNEKSTEVEIAGTIAAGDTITINGVTFTAVDSATTTGGATEFHVSAAIANLQDAISAHATFDGNIDNTTSGTLAIAVDSEFLYEGVAVTGDISAAAANDRGERYDLAQQYDELMEQLDTNVVDAPVQRCRYQLDQW